MSFTGPRYASSTAVDQTIRDGVTRLRTIPGVVVASATSVGTVGSIGNGGVEEIPLYLPCGEGEHTYAVIEKRGVTTLEAIRRSALSGKPVEVAPLLAEVGL